MKELCEEASTVYLNVVQHFHCVNKLVYTIYDFNKHNSEHLTTETWSGEESSNVGRGSFLSQKSEGYQYLLERVIMQLKWMWIPYICQVSGKTEISLNLGCPRYEPVAPIGTLQSASNRNATKIASYKKGAIISDNK